MKRIFKSLLICIAILLLMLLVSVIFNLLGENTQRIFGYIAISYMAISIYKDIRDN